MQALADIGIFAAIVMLTAIGLEMMPAAVVYFGAVLFPVLITAYFQSRKEG
jgi:hypothetical protein